MEAVRQDADAAEFRGRFAAVTPLIRAEWPGLDAAALAKTEGDLDATVALVAAFADRTKVATRRALLELLGEATRQTTARPDGVANDGVANGAAAVGTNDAAHTARAAAEQIDDALATLRRFEAFAAEEAKRVTTKLVPETEAHVKKNVWTSLLIALGIGLVLGLWLNGGRRRG